MVFNKCEKTVKLNDSLSTTFYGKMKKLFVEQNIKRGSGPDFY